MSDLNRNVSHHLDDCEQPEEEAISLFNFLKDRFGWAGTVITRDDVEEIAQRDLTDKEWEAITDSRPWRDMASTWFVLGGWDPVYAALQEAGVDYP